MTSELKPGQIRCERFGNGTKLLCARSPHITMGNLYCVENALSGGIWDYFDLGENTDLDWGDVAAKYDADEELKNVRNIFQLVRRYEQKYSQKW